MKPRLSTIVAVVFSVAWACPAQAGSDYVLITGYEGGYGQWSGKVVTGTGTLCDTSLTVKYRGTRAARHRCGSTDGTSAALLKPDRSSFVSLSYWSNTNRIVGSGAYRHPVQLIQSSRTSGIGLFSTTQWHYAASSDSFQLGWTARDDIGGYPTTNGGIYPKKEWIRYEIEMYQSAHGWIRFKVNGETLYDAPAILDTSYVDSVLVGWIADASFGDIDTGTVYYDDVVYSTVHYPAPQTRIFEAHADPGGLSEWWGANITGTGNILRDSLLTSFSGTRALVAVPSVAGWMTVKQILPPVQACLHFEGQINADNFQSGSPVRQVLYGYARGNSSVRLQLFMAAVSGGYRIGLTLSDDVEIIQSNTPIDTVSGGSWHRLNWCQCRGAGDGVFQIDIDGQTKYSAANLTTTNSMIDSMLVGLRVTNPVSESGWVAWDEIYVHSMPCPPPCGLTTRLDRVPSRVQVGMWW